VRCLFSGCKSMNHPLCCQVDEEMENIKWLLFYGKPTERAKAPRQGFPFTQDNNNR
jgi:hypothetical protein